MLLEFINQWGGTIIGAIGAGVAVYVGFRVDIARLQDRIQAIEESRRIVNEYTAKELGRLHELSTDAHSRLDKLMRSRADTL